MGDAWIFIGSCIGLIIAFVIFGLFIHGSDNRW